MGANLTLRRLADRTGKPEIVIDVVTGPDGVDREQAREVWPLAGVALVGDAPSVHGFRYSYLEQAEAEGWAEVSMSRVVLHLTTGDLAWRVTGRWPSGNGVDVELETAKRSRSSKSGG